MSPLRACAMLLVALALAGLAGCQKGGGPSKTKVAFVSNNSFDFWLIAKAGCDKAQGELKDVEVDFRMPANGTAADQKEIIDSLMAQQVNAIAISVIDPKNQTPYLNRIAEKVPLLTQDNDAPESKRVCYIGTNNYEAGKEVGRLVKEAMPEGGTLAIFVGQIEPLNARERKQGVLDELAGKKDAEGPAYGKYKLHGVFTDNTDTRRAKENALNALNALQGEKHVCLIGLWAYNPPAMLSAYKDYTGPNKADVRMVGFDENTETLRGVEDGQIYATVVQDPFGFGYESVKMMTLLARKADVVIPPGGVLYVPHQVVTKDGGKGRKKASEYRAYLEGILGKK